MPAYWILYPLPLTPYPLPLSATHHLPRTSFRPSERRYGGIERALQHAITLMAEEIESLGDVVERKAVRDERRQIHATLGDHFHEPAHPFFASGTQGRDDLL